MNPKECRYTKGHTWVKVENNEATVGITDYAQEQLGSVLFLEVAEVGRPVAQFQPCGTVESDKATSDIMSPVSGQVTTVNEEVLNAPELVNQDPYGASWLFKARLSDPQELNALMTAEEFEAYIAQG
ncbi:MAG: glycine cleavage system protein GcvH [Chloroflexi bacterium]|nr:glycine cleavage system protein GcvH [Chloroflexota bacterium]